MEYRIIGSSPRVWGQVAVISSDSLKARIIPTRMGTSSTAMTFSLWYRDHPHAYGDKYMDEIAFETYGGSSPRVWGQALAVCQFPCVPGIIPTRMGTSFILDKFPYLRQGSSPRVWGQDYPINLHLLITRIIPTRMGTRINAHHKNNQYRDHPHAYGDK